MRDYGNTNAAPYASAPAVGPAGDTYWNTTSKVLYASDGTAWNAVGPGVGGPPTGTAGGDLTGTYPNPTLVTAQKNLWQVSGASITPVDITDYLAVLGDLDGYALQLGSRTVKSRLRSGAAADFCTLTMNRGGPSLTADDATKPQWSFRIGVDTDNVQIERTAAGPGATTQPLTLDGAGKVTIPGTTVSTTDQSQIQLGTSTIKGRVHLESGPTARLDMGVNARLASSWTSDDTTKPSWLMTLGGGDQASIYRAPASAGALAFAQPFYVNGADGKTYCTLGDTLVTTAMLAAKATVRTFTGVTPPTAWSTLTANAWVRMFATPSLSLRGGAVLICAMLGGYITVNPTGGAVYMGIDRDSTIINSWKCEAISPVTANTKMPIPTFTWLDTGATAGSHTYGFQIYQTANILMIGANDNLGYMQINELA